MHRKGKDIFALIGSMHPPSLCVIICLIGRGAFQATMSTASTPLQLSDRTIFHGPHWPEPFAVADAASFRLCCRMRICFISIPEVILALMGPNTNTYHLGALECCCCCCFGFRCSQSPVILPSELDRRVRAAASGRAGGRGSPNELDRR